MQYFVTCSNEAFPHKHHTPGCLDCIQCYYWLWEACKYSVSASSALCGDQTMTYIIQVLGLVWAGCMVGTLYSLALSGTLALWHSGTLTLWNSGTLAFWHSGTLVWWHSDTLTLWNSGTLAFWHSNTLALWHSGTLTLLDSGNLWLCHSGTLAFWHSGFWHSGILAL